MTRAKTGPKPKPREEMSEQYRNYRERLIREKQQAGEFTRLLVRWARAPIRQ